MKREGFALVPHMVALSDSLSARAKLVFLALAAVADQRGECWPGVAWIAKQARTNRPRARQAIAELVAEGFVTVEPRKSGHGDDETHLYHVLRVESARRPSEAGDVLSGGADGLQAYGQAVNVVDRE